MQDDDGYFGERVAARYDDASGEQFDPAVIDATVDFLAALADGGRALELGIGTGRIALPLAGRGIPVHGIELSKAMAARLRAKPGGEAIEVTIGDFSTAHVDGTFRLAYLVFNTIMNLTTQAAQVACFRNVARHLEPGGAFVVEVGVPDLQRLPPGDTFRVFEASEAHWGIDEYDVANQGLISHHFHIREGEIELGSTPFRYVWPSELDLMAQMAGMELSERWAGWGREPFTSLSTSHVSVWRMTPVTDPRVFETHDRDDRARSPGKIDIRVGYENGPRSVVWTAPQGRTALPAVLLATTEQAAGLLLGPVDGYRAAFLAECDRAESRQAFGRCRARRTGHDRHALVGGLQVEERVVRQLDGHLRAEEALDVAQLQDLAGEQVVEDEGRLQADGPRLAQVLEQGVHRLERGDLRGDRQDDASLASKIAIARSSSVDPPSMTTMS